MMFMIALIFNTTFKIMRTRRAYVTVYFKIPPKSGRLIGDYTNDPIFRSCAMKQSSTQILGFADILEFVCAEMFPINIGCNK